MSPIDYIPYLRGMIGHKKCLSVGLSSIVLNEKNEILLEKRSDNQKYCLPGGSIDLNETVIEGTKREVKEETGIDIENIKLFAIRSGEKCDFYYPNGDITQYVDLIFISNAKKDSKIIPQESETEKVFFISFDEIKKMKEEDFLKGSYFAISKFIKGDFEVTID